MIALIDLINLTKPYLTNTLISPDSLNSIEAHCSKMSPVYHTIYYEIRANEDKRVDLTSMSGAVTFSDYLDKNELESNNYLTTIKKWLSNVQVPLMSVEFDFVDNQVKNSFFIWAVHKGYTKSKNGVFDPVEAHKLIVNCLKYEDVLLAAGLDNEIKNTLNKVPVMGNVLHVLSLKSRGLDAIRIVVGIPILSCKSFLKSISWTGNYDLLQSLIDIIKQFNFVISFQLTYSEKLMPSIGLEVYAIDPSNIQRNKLEFRLFFKLLEKQNLIDSGKIDDVVNWPGISRVNAELIDWKMDILRDVNVKFIISNDQFPEVKYYLGANAVYKLF